MSERRGVIYSEDQLRAMMAEASRDADRHRGDPASAAYGEAIARLLYWGAVLDDKPMAEQQRLKDEWEAEERRAGA